MNTRFFFEIDILLMYEQAFCLLLNLWPQFIESCQILIAYTLRSQAVFCIGHYPLLQQFTDIVHRADSNALHVQLVHVYGRIFLLVFIARIQIILFFLLIKA